MTTEYEKRPQNTATAAANGLTVSVIVPVHNGGEKFRRCLKQLSQLDPQPQELLVVADGDTDGSWQAAVDMSAHAFRLRTRKGPACARNYGAREARGDILLFIDADVIVPLDTIQQIQTAFAQQPSLDAVFGSYDDAPEASNFYSQYANLLLYYVHQNTREQATSFWAPCGAVRREVFRSLNGFDECYWEPSIEDRELGYRLKRSGANIRLLKTLQVKHLKSWTATALLQTEISRRALPWTDLVVEQRRFPDRMQPQVAGRIGLCVFWGLLAVITAVWQWPDIGPVFIAGFLCGLLLLNARLGLFFWKKRGPGFAVRAILWHWLTYSIKGCVSSLGFLRALVFGVSGRRRMPTPDLA